ncbi:MAG: hypothetical protein DCC88_03620 [Spirobacillus cienkowskii]|uniref:Uncharacterized protein n=1 Tax=Spirobacillus cienkowskii TaxID=495820 RepID=A0A369KVJ5_9BACT|nr:MAG: hypothetical protein DCC88_03620 [Spirobacillus cienkowskii]
MFFNPNKLIVALKNESLKDEAKIKYFLLFFSFNFFISFIVYLISFDESYKDYHNYNYISYEEEISYAIELVCLIYVLCINGVKDIFLRYVSLKTVLSIISFCISFIFYFIGLEIQSFLENYDKDFFNIFYVDWLLRIFLSPYLFTYLLLNISLIYYFYKINKK